MLPFQHEKLKDIHNLLSVGVPRFERGTPCSQSRCANRTALHPETFKRHKGTHYISICNPIAPRKPFGGGDTRERSDPGGIQTHDLQNRNLTLYSAKLPSLIASLCPAKVHFSSQPLDTTLPRIETIAPICLLYEKKKSSPFPLKVGGEESPLFCGTTHTLSCGFVSVWITSLPVYPLGREQEWMLLFV